MSTPRMTVLVVGATGSIGRLVVEEALREGHAVRDMANQPLEDEPDRVRRDLDVVSGNRPATGTRQG